LTFIIDWYLRSGIEEHSASLSIGEPWSFEAEKEVWCYNGIDIKGDNSTVIYLSLSGKSHQDHKRAGALLSAFMKILGEEELQEAYFKKLMI
jgi:hypothetical protein